jgi:SynChlorMet cassette radical SAM/SPASM protein ScmF
VETFEAAVLEAKPLGLKAVKWTGGEPTIHPQFPSLLEIQRKHELQGRVETNGMEVTETLARQMKDSGVHHVAVSLDGARPETHNAIRGVQGAHRRALRGVGNLVEVGFKPQLIMTLMRENVGELESLLDLAEEVGAGSVKLNIVQPTLRGEEMHASGETLTVLELIELNRRVDSELAQEYAFPIFYDIPMAFRSLRHMLEGDGCSVCGIMGILGLLADGHYALCGIGEHVPEMVFGRAGVGELERIWSEHPVLLQIRKGLPGQLKGVCERCLMKGACLGSCVAQNYYRSQDLLAPYWFCELAEEAGLFPATRLR